MTEGSTRQAAPPRFPPIHPFLLAAYPILFLFGQNLGEASIGEIIVPLVVSLLVTSAIYGLATLLLRDAGRGALVASLAVVTIFGYGRIRDALADTPASGGRLLLAWASLAVVTYIAILMVRRRPIRLTTVLNVLTTILVVTASVPIVIGQINGLSGGTAAGVQPTAAATTGGVAAGPKHDIYYIMVEDMGSERTLRENYGLKEAGLFDWFEDSGFQVAAQSKTNYNKTVQALASSLNMTYLDAIAAQVGAGSGDYHPLYQMIDKPGVAEFLKAQGYRYDHIGGWWDPTEKSSIADRNWGIDQQSDFVATLYRTTILPDVAAKLARFGIRPPAEADASGEASQYASAVYGFKALDEMAVQPGPKFVFAHFLIPHDPFVFTADGARVTAASRKGKTKDQLFIDQLKYTNTRVREAVEKLLSGPEETRPIVIVQTDEGPNPDRYEQTPETFQWADSTDEELRAKFEILNAYYLPGADAPKVAPTITPVNTFRLILSHYFGAELPLLPDREYIFRDKVHPYDFTDVTKNLTPK